METIISAKKLIKNFKSGQSEIKVLKGLDLEIKDGEFVTIIGRSGSGKSTLLYQLSLLDRPTAGEIIFEGKNTQDLSDDERTKLRLHELGYVFQDYALVPELTALENVLIPLLMQEMDRKIAVDKAIEHLTLVGLEDRINNLPSQLSGGEQQRVSIARAIAHEPKIIFADEPTANLDNETALTIIKIFAELHKQGQTILMVTHEEEYTHFSDRTITLFDGIIKEDKKK